MTILEIIAGYSIGAVIGYCTNYIAVRDPVSSFKTDKNRK